MSRNPFVINFLNKNPHLSSSAACTAEAAWDAAIEAVLLAKDDKGKISVGKVKALMSTKQRVTGPDVPLDPSRTPTRDMTIAEIEAALTPDQKNEIIALTANGKMLVPPTKRLREIVSASLKTAVDYVRHLNSSVQTA